MEGVPDEEGDLLDGDLLVGGEDDWLHLLVLAQHPDEQSGQVCREFKGIKEEIRRKLSKSFAAKFEKKVLLAFSRVFDSSVSYSPPRAGESFLKKGLKKIRFLFET